MAENENKQPAGSRRMKILQQSLAKKQAAFDQRLQNHFDDVRSANGQPLNDKRTPSWILPFLITKIATSSRGSAITLYHSRSALPQLSKAQTQPLYNNPLRNVYRQFKDSTKSGYLI